MSRNKGVINDENQISLFSSFDWDTNAEDDRRDHETGESENLSQITFSENLDNSSKIVRNRSRKSRSTIHEEPKLDLWDAENDLPRDDRKHSKNQIGSTKANSRVLGKSDSSYVDDYCLEIADQSLSAKQKFKNNLKAVKALRSL